MAALLLAGTLRFRKALSHRRWYGRRALGRAGAGLCRCAGAQLTVELDARRADRPGRVRLIGGAGRYLKAVIRNPMAAEAVERVHAAD